MNIPTVLHVHGGFRTGDRRKRLLYGLFDRAARRHKANRFDHFIALSATDKDHLLHLNVSESKVSIIRNAAEAQAFERLGTTRFREEHGLVGKRVILYLSILIGYKRPERLILALPRLVEKVPDAFVLFVGPDAGELEKIRALARRLGVAEYYKWLGPMHGKEKHEAFECCEFLALPSDDDPYPLALLEAMAHGKPVLTTSGVGQAPVISGHRAGIIFPPGDLDGLVEGATRLLTDETYRSATAANARRLAESMFSVGAVVDELELLYRRLLDRNGATVTFPAAGSVAGQQ